MERLNEDTLRDFIKTPGVSLILFGSNIGRPTLEQAHEFAEFWAEHSDDCRFGYVDALINETASKAHGIRVLPTILVVRDGAVVNTLRGYSSRRKMENALAQQPSVSVAA